MKQIIIKIDYNLLYLCQGCLSKETLVLIGVFGGILRREPIKSTVT